MSIMPTFFPLADTGSGPRGLVGEKPTADPESMTGGVPRGTIRGDEAVVLVLRPSRWYILLEPLPWLGFLVVIASLVTIATAAMSNLGMTPFLSTGWTWIIAAAIGLILLAWECLEWRFRVYVLTTHRVLTCAGVIRRSIYETSLVNVRQTMISVSVLERCTGIGSLLFATAGTAFYDTAWVMLSDPAMAQRQVQDLIRRATRSRAA
ncbi:MAG: PH domain-containing protein [Phycisphaerales bacterium]|nr:PH domain-containing protein [Phycisphaerales bacterium]